MSEIYFSYAWKDRDQQDDGREKIVNDLCEAFERKGHQVIRDKTVLKYKDSITGFMQKIGKGGFIVTVISGKYLRSKYCMYEAVEILKKGDFKDRVFPIVLDDSNIYDDLEMGKLTIYWQTQVKELKKLSDEIEDDTSKIQYLNIKKDYEEILRKFGDFLQQIRDMKVLGELLNIETKYSEIITSIENRIAASKEMEVTVPATRVATKVPIVFRALTLLNYNPQYEIFDKYSTHQYGLFYIHGCFASGQYWLAKRFAYSITQGDEEFEVLKIEDSKQNNSDTIERMESYLQIGQGQLFPTLAAKLVHKKIIFLIDENDPLYFLDNFWSGFLAHLDKSKATETRPLFIFLYDGNENKQCSESLSLIQKKDFQLKNYTFPLVEIPITPENISREDIEDWWKDVRRALPQLQFPCTKEELTLAILQKTSVISEEVIRIICKKFGLRYTDILEFKN